MNTHKIILIVIVLIFLLKNNIILQNNNLTPINSSLAFLKIIGDARSQVLGGISSSSEPDPYAIFSNSAKTIFSPYGVSMSVTYSPLFFNLGIYDIHYTNFSYTRNFENTHALGLGVRYLNIGDFNITDNNANLLQTMYSYEASFEVSYAYKIKKKLSTGVNVRLANSSLANNYNINEYRNRNIFSLAGDLSIFYNNYIKAKKSKILAGAVFSNIGGTISKHTTSYSGINYLPTKLDLGLGYAKYIGYDHKVYFGIGLSNIMLPITDSIPTNENENKSYSSKNYFSSVFSTSNLMRGWYYSAGIEYAYRNFYFVRGGIRYRKQNFGGGTFVALGLGTVLSDYNLGIDVSYIIPINTAKFNSDPNYNSVKLSIYLELFPVKFSAENIRCAKVF